MADTLPTRSAVTRAGFLLAGGLLGVAFSGPAPGGLEECRDPGWAPSDAGGRRLVCAAAPPHRLERGESAEILLFGGRLDLNRANAAALEVLPGVGPRRAQAIVAARGERPFSGVGDLVRVYGIGRGTVERIRPWVEVSPRSGDPEASP